MESKSPRESPEDVGGDADANGGEQPASGNGSEDESQAAGEGTPARQQPSAADLQRAHQVAARLETAVADAERERHQWQELPAPVARHSPAELLLVASATGLFAAVFMIVVLWGAGVIHFDAPSFGGADAAAQGQQEQRQAGGGAMSARRIGAAYERFTESERAVWNRDCQPLRERLAGQGAGDGLSESERTTWRGQCRQMVANMLE